MKKIGIVLLVGAVGWYFLNRYKSALNVKTVLKNIKFGGSWLNPKIILILGVQNASNLSGVLRSITGEVSTNNKTIADFSYFGSTTIEANKETEIAVTAVPVSVNVFTTILNLFKQKQIPDLITVTGSLNFNNTVFPLNLNFKL